LYIIKEIWKRRKKEEEKKGVNSFVDHPVAYKEDIKNYI
jgi:hypothetical protein